MQKTALYNHNPEWYEHWWISDRGTLKSDDPSIDKLLQPLGSFIEVYACEYSSN
ncbi:hypothetical protein [Phormidesmis priestleyi]